jgi:hypothetical protein
VQDGIVTLSHKPGLIDLSAAKEPALLRTDRQLRSEGLPIFYMDNVFATCSQKALSHWLRCLGAHRRGLVRHLRGYSFVRASESETCAQWVFAKFIYCQDPLKDICNSTEQELARHGLTIKTGVFQMPVKDSEEQTTLWLVGSDGSKTVGTKEVVVGGKTFLV